MQIPDITLIAVTPTLVEALADQSAFEVRYGVTVGDQLEHIRMIVAMTVANAQRKNPPPAYGGYLAADAQTMQLVGCCGFNGGPNDAGEAEIAYGTFPPFEGRGYAKAMARALVHRALDAGAPHVIAHTMPEVNASGSILRGAGFVQTGTVIADPEDGPVWRWELSTNE